MTFPTESDQYLAEFEAPIVEARKPTLPELLDLDILEAVGTEYGKFGVLLLNDEIGSLVNVIKHDCHTLKILHKWLEGVGESPTWSTHVQRFYSPADKVKKQYLFNVLFVMNISVPYKMPIQWCR